MAAVLARADGFTPLGELTRGYEAETRHALLTEALDLWGARLVQLLPDPCHAGRRS
jgi:hypothetical protein